MANGVSFRPGAVQPGSVPTRQPLQEAVKILSLQMPKRTAGVNPLASGTGSGFTASQPFLPRTAPPAVAGTPTAPGPGGGVGNLDQIAQALQAMAGHSSGQLPAPAPTDGPWRPADSLDGVHPFSTAAPAAPVPWGSAPNEGVPAVPSAPVPYSPPPLQPAPPVTPGTPQTLPAGWDGPGGGQWQPWTGGGTTGLVQALMNALQGAPQLR